MPLSGAEAHMTRDAAAREATLAKIMRERTTENMAVAPPVELVAWVKISMKGKPVGVVRAVVMSPMQKRIAMSMAKPRVPLMPMLARREWGNTVEAFLISSHMWTAPSAPRKAKMVVMRPTKNDVPAPYPPRVR